MSPSTIPIRWLQTEGEVPVLGTTQTLRPLLGQAPSSNVLQEDGSRAQAAVFHPLGGAYPSEVGSNSPQRSEERSLELPPPPRMICPPTSPNRGSSGRHSARQSPGPAIVKPTQTSLQAEGGENVSRNCSGSDKRAIPAGELIACLQEANRGSWNKESARQTTGCGVEMPVARPSLEDSPADEQRWLETLVWAVEQSKPGRGPGVDRRGPLELAPIEPPSPSPPRLPIGSEELSSPHSGRQKHSRTSDRAGLDLQLRRVLDSWPVLPRRTREAILGMIEGALGKKQS